MPSDRMKRKFERYNRKIEKYQKKIKASDPQGEQEDPRATQLLAPAAAMGAACMKNCGENFNCRYNCDGGLGGIGM